ncbi:Succinyl-CoA ligase [ADP-forming] beta chain (EC 6.2.1.5) [uncultured Gammaproteobacteria bacterium]|jgi:succinyl-CoA synthetase beta subunit|uniref:Succinate--CoA ligase [ADP-forming] subunit beta n=3 Tax=sulfur-oxidizing symbionts TaxID=32036 RepID=A0A1H6MRH5_9GAMM|nr:MULTISPECIES: ADP-forming succinate--CoA ligase subunit beta [sulfur-oxidizing symbionts]CAC5851198.1 Succinyl-CoA ligase [ADP-forming] beta chain (EC 6.2.1.5) [uncultured Gammaproteobacteria bacterium]CAB5506256.1 Succinyl-CoA ligase [ADP-forming] beta chain (EC [Bathymodiolus azoricus thioautotrophic gill symbiont]CAB5507857.1 Succinyl-CoA ligase [ADP-forming] beta chain (EC [Bathymodiolus thermophilus thioautotrophic gill symbiont]CAC9503555.1 Succinyl-CoA ligase [ADP-forming] beta chain 
MHIHEYQAKTLFNQFSIKTPKGVLVSTVEQLSKACSELGGSVWVVKAQVHTGGRGKGGGVILCHSMAEVAHVAEQLLGTQLVTPQTDAKGLPINQLLIEAGQNIERELYLGLLVDRQTQKITVLASTEGGMDIEKVASETPDKIIKFGVDPLGTLSSQDCDSIAQQLNLTDTLAKQFNQTLLSLYEIFTTKDVSLIEINPLIVTAENTLLALDGKIDFDDNALYRHEDILQLRDTSQEDEKEKKASEHQLNYISLDGTIGCMVNGAGLAMATMDLIEHHGGSPANFLDVGGGTTAQRVAKAFELIQTEANVSGILVNIFGGIVRCDLIAQGILQAIEKVGLSLPIVVRLEGTNAAQGLALLSRSKYNIYTEADLTQAAIKIVALSQEQSK